jgi:ribosomal protein L7/L12
MIEPVFAASISPTLILVIVVTIGALVGVLMLRRRRNENVDVEHQAPPRRPLRTPGAIHELNPEVVLQLAAQNKIEAIRLVRERTGMGLKEAKDYVEALSSDRPVSLPPSPATTEFSDLDSEVRQLVSQGNLIEAIRLVRERTGMGLKEAKDYVDRLE